MSRSLSAPEAQVRTSQGSLQVTTLLRLRELLLSGEFQPGERMAEIPLAKRLRVSRTPLRLALISLEHEGLLLAHPTRGFLVREFRIEDIYDTIDLRGLLEGMAGRLAVERRHRQDALALAALASMEESVHVLDGVIPGLSTNPAESLERYIAANDQFHRGLLDLAQSAMLTRELNRIAGLPFAGPSSGFVTAQSHLLESQRILRMAQDQHHAILEAIQAGEASRVENLLREHARLSRKNLQIVLDNGGMPPLVAGLRVVRATVGSRALDTPAKPHEAAVGELEA